MILASSSRRSVCSLATCLISAARSATRRCARPFAVRLGRRRQRLLHLFVGRGRVLLHHIPGRGVDHCVQTHVTPLTHGSDLGVEVVAVPEA